MKNDLYKKIIRNINSSITKDAKTNDLMWFYNLHLKEVVSASQELLKLYKADEHVVIIASWLHDVSMFKVGNKEETEMHRTTHHIDSRKISENILDKFNIKNSEKNAILNCVVKHRNIPGYMSESMEEKIVAVADIVSHFNSVFYFTYFKHHPHDTIDQMVKKQYSKINKDWNDLELLPKSKKLVKDKYLFLKELCENYNL